jgi:hypothetical protein
MTPEEILKDLIELSKDAQDLSSVANKLANENRRDGTLFWEGVESGIERVTPWVDSLIAKIKQHLGVPPVA